MNKFKDLFDFIDFAKGNRKYPENTANGLKSALKIFEKVLNVDELNSIDLIEDNIEEIFINAVSHNKDKNIGSLNTYKARLLKVIKDYQRYGINPSKIQGWAAKIHKSPVHHHIKKDRLDKKPDSTKTDLSYSTNTPVNNIHKIELALRPDTNFIISVPRDITANEAKKLKNILDSLVIE